MNREAGKDLAQHPKASASSVRERLGAMLERGMDAIGPWNRRRILRELNHILDPAVSEVEGGRRAAAFAQWYAGATPEQRHDCWSLMSGHFTPELASIEAAHGAWEAARGTEDESMAEVRLRRAFSAPRTRLLQRFIAYPGGLAFLVGLRAELLSRLKQDKRLLALDEELRELFATWFNIGFLDLRRISWDSPASLIEKIIRYEAVHDIRSWADARNRLDEDRRCYAFFHPRMPDEPLIFIEVALLDEMAAGIVPVLDEEEAPADPRKASCATFYSISNTQQGLKGVSFGDELIKRVVEVLQREFPRLKVFATLSPIPGFRAWLGHHLPSLLADTSARLRAELARELKAGVLQEADLLEALEEVPSWPEKSARARWLLGAAAHYLARATTDERRPLDPVARFHLGNGARVERLNWLGNPFPKGLRQSHGLMVNYLYDLKRLERQRALLDKGQVPLSGEVESLLF